MESELLQPKVSPVPPFLKVIPQDVIIYMGKYIPFREKNTFTSVCKSFQDLQYDIWPLHKHKTDYLYEMYRFRDKKHVENCLKNPSIINSLGTFGCYEQKRIKKQCISIIMSCCINTYLYGDEYLWNLFVGCLKRSGPNLRIVTLIMKSIKGILQDNPKYDILPIQRLFYFLNDLHLQNIMLFYNGGKKTSMEDIISTRRLFKHGSPQVICKHLVQNRAFYVDWNQHIWKNESYTLNTNLPIDQITQILHEDMTNDKISHIHHKIRARVTLTEIGIVTQNYNLLYEIATQTKDNPGIAHKCINILIAKLQHVEEFESLLHFIPRVIPLCPSGTKIIISRKQFKQFDCKFLPIIKSLIPILNYESLLMCVGNLFERFPLYNNLLDWYIENRQSLETRWAEIGHLPNQEKRSKVGILVKLLLNASHIINGNFMILLKITLQDKTQLIHRSLIGSIRDIIEKGKYPVQVLSPFGLSCKDRTLVNLVQSQSRCKLIEPPELKSWLSGIYHVKYNPCKRPNLLCNPVHMWLDGEDHPNPQTRSKKVKVKLETSEKQNMQNQNYHFL